VCIERILRAGYDMSAEEAEMGRQMAVDDNERARQRAALEQARAEAEAKAERTRHFAYGTLSIDDLNYNEIKEHLVSLGVPGKEEELRARLKVACSTGKRKAKDDEIGAQQASAEKKAKRHRVKDTRGQHDN
jgi:hypothetical protein